ncbi:MAG TPA: MlaD family protein, partial [Gemmatimonadales bacterium]|nr:MlaD family protein [Gemmatimonadales bacterium]
ALATIGITMLGGGQLFARKVPFVSYFAGGVTGLRVGAPVRFRGIIVGEVTGIYLGLGVPTDTLLDRIPITYEIDERRVQRRGASGERLRNRQVVDSLIDRGLRASLETESFVTGQKYIALEFRPDVPVQLVRDPALEFTEIPTVPHLEADLQAEVARLLREISKIDFPGLANRLSRVLEHFDEFFTDIEIPELARDVRGALVAIRGTSDSLAVLSGRTGEQLGPTMEALRRSALRLDSSLVQLDSTLIGARAALDPEAPAFVRVEEAMRELSGASQALRSLGDYLERNPGALLRGRPGEEIR